MKGETCSRSTQVFIAALNEEEGIGPTIKELKRYVDTSNILVVDGKSSDRTVEVAKNLGAEIAFQDGVGKGDALSKAVKHIDPNADYVIITDADYTYPAKYLQEMLEILDENPEVGMVCGNRFGSKVHATALNNLFYFGNRLIAFTHNLLNGVQLQDPLTGLRVVRAEVLRGWNVKSQGFDVEVELNHHTERKGFGIVEVPIKYRTRLGTKKLKVTHGATILKRILLETFY